MTRGSSRPRLSVEQRAACARLEGPLRVLAGAGTGKTTVIVERFRRLVERGIDPASILVMTFTERAASEMQERIEVLTGRVPPAVGTFHAIALRWLHEMRSSDVRPGFRMLTGADRWIELRELLWEIGNPALVGVERPDDLVGPLLGLQERLKQELVPIDRLRRWAWTLEDPEQQSLYLAAAQLFGIAERRARQRNQLDFDDLLLRCVRALEGDAELRARYRGRFPWIMVDEYQDTNTAQERLVELLGAPDGNVAVVGDDDQSIYRFRGASRASMERFLSRFPGAESLTLSRNRRSSPAIVRAARAVIEQDHHRFPKPILPSRSQPAGPPVAWERYPDGWSENHGIAQRLRAAHEAGVPWSQQAVLVRTHGIAAPLLAALDEERIPYHHRGGPGLYRRPEVRDLIAYLRLLDDPGDLHAVSRLLQRPPLRLDLEEALGRLREPSRHPEAEREGSGALGPLHVLATWEPAAAWAESVLEVLPRRAVLGVEDLLFHLMERTRHVDHLVADARPVEVPRLLACVDRFRELVGDFAARTRDQSLRGFLDHLDLVLLSQVDEPVPAPSGEDAVQVLTIHQAKGLEFQVVVVPSLVEGRLPHHERGGGIRLPATLVDAPVRAREDHLGEERRLLYVAMSRARTQLCLSYAEHYEGSRRWRPSRFLEPGRELRIRLVDGPAASPPPPPGPAAARDRAPGPGPALSYSSISTYRECPRQYWYRSRLRLEAPLTAEAQLGVVVHDTLEAAGRVRRSGDSLTAPGLRGLYDDAWATQVAADPRRRAVLQALGWDLLRGALERGDLDQVPTHLEEPFAVKFEGWSLRGYIDRIERDGDGDGDGWRVVDFKSGRPLRAADLRRDLQLALYALGARRGLGLEEGAMELVISYLRRGERVTITADDALLEHAERIGGEVADEIRQGRFEPRPLARRCALCPYRLACPAGL